jgi:beta-hydroxylase
MKYFYDPLQFEWTKILEKEYPTIKKEWARWPKFLRTPISHRQQSKLKEIKSWDLVSLMYREKPVWYLKYFFPSTYSLINKLPIFENLGFSTIYPGGKITKHCGWTDKIVRVHLAIDTNTNSALHCGNDSRSLKNGEILIFEDGHDHWAYNYGDRERTVLLFDVLKEDINL